MVNFLSPMKSPLLQNLISFNESEKIVGKKHQDFVVAIKLLQWHNSGEQCVFSCV